MNGEQLKYIRKALNLSQTELGERLGLRMVTVWRYEKGKQEPLPRTLRRMQQVLNYTEEDLLDINELLQDKDADQRKHARLKQRLREQAHI